MGVLPVPIIVGTNQRAYLETRRERQMTTGGRAEFGFSSYLTIFGYLYRADLRRVTFPLSC